jgi:hypothetical protein
MVGEPIDVEGRGDEHDMHAVRSLRREVEGALHEMIEDELARRLHFPSTSPTAEPATRPKPSADSA